MTDIENIQGKTILHYILRTSPDKNKRPIYVEAINALNPFVKPGYNFVSVSVNKKTLAEFKKLLDEHLVEAYFYF